MNHVRAAVVLLVPCLSAGTVRRHHNLAPALAKLLGGPSAVSMRSAGEIQHFPGDQGASRAACRMIRAILSARAKPPVTGRKAPSDSGGSTKQRPPISTYLASKEERARSGYPSREMLGKEGWVCTASKEGDNPGGPPEGGSASAASPDADPDRVRLVAIDCEMVLTAAGHVLARVSVVGSDGALLYDTLVRPAEPVTDYLTEFSGITEEKLADVKVTLGDVQAKLQELLSDQSIIVGHSLENDLNALRLVHERVVDTVLIYPHARGWPHRQGLAGLSGNLLKRKLDRRSGHDSIEDARVALDLALLKFSKGPGFGATGGESAPLGRLLRGSGVQLSLSDPAGPSSPASGTTAPWHLEGCACGGAACQPQGGGAAGEAGGGDTAAANGEVESPSRPREVRLVVLRDFEALCEEGSPVDGGASPAGARLAELDAQVARMVAGLGDDEMLLLITGCGDLHQLRKLQAEEAAANERSQAQEAFKDAFGVFAVGGEALQAALKAAGYDLGNIKSRLSEAAPPPQREVVSYDD